MLEDLVRRTPPERDRVVDAVRAAAIAVVVLWHWVGSLTHRGPGGAVVMPNPIADVPGAWLATWALQVVPAFFVVGGYANLAAWDAGGGRAGTFLRRRARRLLAPVGVWLGLWAGVEVLGALAVDGHRPLWAWFPGVLVPLWFVLAYAAVTAAVPLTARAHRAAGPVVLAGLAAALVVSEVLARGSDVPGARWVSVALVWVLVHQLGYLWRDGVGGPRCGTVAVLGGLGALVALTAAAGYPRSMVATTLSEGSNLWPTNATVVAVAVLQLGLVWLAAPWAARLLARPRIWRPVVALNAVALTVFVWHMTAYAAVLVAAERAGVARALTAARPDGDWLAVRPFWLVAPGLVLLALIAVLGRVETGRRDAPEPVPANG